MVFGVICMHLQVMRRLRGRFNAVWQEIQPLDSDGYVRKSMEDEEDEENCGDDHQLDQCERALH